VERSVDEKGVLLELTVDPEDLGRVIGKRGATAQSLRTLLRALGTKNDARYNLKIVDNGDGGSRGASAGGQNDDNPAPKQDDNGDGVVDNGTGNDVVADEPIDIPEDTGEKESDSVSKTRQELAELDDLDI
jgi:predicted RNA-binding protein YlqC (UPF0109 family)